jgi:hypothetical protein
MANKIIKRETKLGKGIYLIEIDKEKSSKVEGANHKERVRIAINEFLQEIQPDNVSGFNSTSGKISPSHF